MKVVYNNCFGGFRVSEAAALRYAELKGLTLYPGTGQFDFIKYWLVPEGERLQDLENWRERSIKERMAWNAQYIKQVFRPDDLPRNDPVLVQVVEELGKEASTDVSNLCICDVPAGAKYRIDEYDGSESVMTQDDYTWLVAE